jgi:uracil phosphoribosyltransferase
MSGLPPNVHVSKHPCLRAKLSQLRSKSTNARETKDLVHEISLILGIEALSGLEVISAGNVCEFLASSDGLLILTTRTRHR